MRIFFVICMILFVTATTLSQERPKRHLSFLKKIVETFLAADIRSPPHEDYKLYEVPGFNHFFRKDTSKEMAKETVDNSPKSEILKSTDPNESFIKSFLDTITSNETLNALHKLKKMLNLDVLSGRESQEINEFLVPLTPEHIKFVTNYDKLLYSLKSPVGTIIKKPEQATYSEVFHSRPLIQHRPVAIEVPTIAVKPIHLTIAEIYEHNYSYKQKRQDGSVTTYKSEGDQNIIVTETDILPVLPSYIKLRMEEVAVKCVSRIHCSQPVPIQKPLYFVSNIKISASSIQMPSSKYTNNKPVSSVTSNKVEVISPADNDGSSTNIKDRNPVVQDRITDKLYYENFFQNNPIVIPDDASIPNTQIKLNETTNPNSALTQEIEQNVSDQATTEESMDISNVIVR